MNSESELHKSQITNSASPNTDVLESKKKTTNNIILVNQKQSGGGGGHSKGSNTSASSSNLRVNYNKRDEDEFSQYKNRKESLISQSYQQQQKENINSTNQMVMGPLEKSILKDHQYGFPNSQQNAQPNNNSASNFLLHSTLNLAPLINGQQPQINNLGNQNVISIFPIKLLQQAVYDSIDILNNEIKKHFRWWDIMILIQERKYINKLLNEILMNKEMNSTHKDIEQTYMHLFVILLKNTNYYQEFWKMYYTNEVIISKLNDYKKEIQQIREKADKLEVINIK